MNTKNNNLETEILEERDRLNVAMLNSSKSEGDNVTEIILGNEPQFSDYTKSILEKSRQYDEELKKNPPNIIVSLEAYETGISEILERECQNGNSPKEALDTFIAEKIGDDQELKKYVRDISTLNSINKMQILILGDDENLITKLTEAGLGDNIEILSLDDELVKKPYFNNFQELISIAVTQYKNKKNAVRLNIPRVYSIKPKSKKRSFKPKRGTIYSIKPEYKKFSI